MLCNNYRVPTSAPENSMDPLLFFERFPEIRYKIVDALSTRDLLNCTQVNRSWRQISTQELSTRSSYVHITKTCQNIRWLCRQLKYGNNCTIDAIKINIPGKHSGGCLEIYEEDVKRQCKNLKKLRLRYLDLRLWTCYKTEMLIREIVLGASDSLEELTIDYGRGSDGDLNLRKSKTEFPKLKIINIGPRYGSSWDDAFDLMRLAPNLQAINGRFNLGHLSKMNIDRCSRLDVITAINIVSYKDMGEIFKLFVRAEPKLMELQISDASKRLIPLRWSRPLMLLLRRGAFTLRRLSICAIKFYHLQRKERFVLEALNFLELHFPLNSTVEEFMKVIASLNLQDSCPALTSLRISFEEEYCIHDMPSRLVSGDQPMCVPVPSVQEITFTEAVCTVGVMEACIVAFPNLTSFGYENLRCTEICVDQSDEHFYGVYKIWTEISTLEKLRICLSNADRAPKGVCMDALFCGISTGEVVRVKRICTREEVDLKKRQYCPLRPSLLYAKNLKLVTLVFAPGYSYHRMFCISEVTECLVLARNPSIRLCIESHCLEIEDELQSVAQFAEIITVTEGGDWW